jgi:hypothetical protein
VKLAIASANAGDLIDAIQSDDPAAIGNALGVPVGVLIDYELRLTKALDNLLAEFPEMALLMSRRPQLPTIQEATERLRATAELSATSAPETFALPNGLGSSSKFKRRSSSLHFIPFPVPDPGDGDTDPGDGDTDAPPLPPMTEPPPDQVESADQVSCAYLPYIASLVTCGLGGSALAASSFGTGSLAFFACASVAYCQFCEGGVVDDVCEP